MPRGAKKPRRRSSSRKKINNNNNDKKKKTSTATMQNIEEEKERVWHLVRPLFVLFGAGLVMNFSMYVEEHPTGGVPDGDPNTILDTGFVATRNAHQYLLNHRFINDIAAFGNSILVVFALVYVGYIALWIGDFGLTFRLLSCQFFRAYCGWFTYLPPSPEFLQSNYDVPELFNSGAIGQMLQLKFPVTVVDGEAGLIPFVSFFSGHVANIVIVANHMYINGYKKLGILFHVLNCLQVYRLLATRGHYSIDIIVGFVVAIHVTNPAERLGLYFSSVSRKELRRLRKQPAEKNIFIKYFENIIDVENNTFTTLRKSNPIQKPPLRELAENLEEIGNRKYTEIGDVVTQSLNDTPQNIRKHLETMNQSYNQMLENLTERHEQNMRKLEENIKELERKFRN